jgi:5-methylcytosine-specific restriction protein A
LKVSDLDAPIWAAKSDWLPGTTWLGFTPSHDGLESWNSRQSTIQRQFRNGYVLEYVTKSIEKPNDGYEFSEEFRREKEHHSELAGRLIAIHRLQTTSTRLEEIVGSEEYAKLQDRWARGGNRRRWSVAFPIVESYEIVGRPLAEDVFGKSRYLEIFTQQSAILRNLSDDDRRSLSSLEIKRLPAANETFLFEAELQRAERSDVDEILLRKLTQDIPEWAMEGEAAERKLNIRKRCAQLAASFIKLRRKNDQLYCDDCSFDPATRVPPGIDPRSLLDAHHLHPIEAGIRRSTIDDFALLCPTCHRLAHLVLKSSKRSSTSSPAA